MELKEPACSTQGLGGIPQGVEANPGKPKGLWGRRGHEDHGCTCRASLLATKCPKLLANSGESVWRRMEGRQIALPCVSLPLPGMKTSTGLLNGPAPPLVTAATRMEQVALVASTGRMATLALGCTSAEMFCWRGRGEKSGLEERAAGGKPRDLLRIGPLSCFCATLLLQARRKRGSELFTENNGPACKRRMGCGEGLSGVSHPNLVLLPLSACQQPRGRQPEHREARRRKASHTRAVMRILTQNLSAHHRRSSTEHLPPRSATTLPAPSLMCPATESTS